MRSEYDVIIIGAGPGGLIAAEELAKHRKSVLIVEKNPEIGPKVCGGGVNVNIAKFGVPLELAETRFSTIQAYSSHKNVTVSLPSDFLYIFDRKIFGQYQLDRVLKYGVDVETGVFIRNITPTNIRVKNLEIKYKYLIGADGSSSMTRKYLGLKTQKYGLTYQYKIPALFDNFLLYYNSKIFGTGYGWIIPHRNHTIIGMGQSVCDRSRINIKQQCHNWCEHLKIDLTQAVPESWPINYDYQGWQFDNIFLIGDAAGLASGLTGMGIAPALLSGLEAARKIINPSYSCPEIKRLLHKKQIQDKILGILQTNPSLVNIYHHVMLSLTGSQRLTRKLVDFLL